jgi:hypothetical protein
MPPGRKRRRKRGDTRLGTLEDKYHVQFHRNRNMRAATLMKEWRVWTITELIAEARSRYPRRRRRRK